MIEDSGWIYPELLDIKAIIAFRGLPPIQDARKIESACARPRQSFGDVTPYPDVASKAAALGWGLARCHGLVDGNKRVAAIVTIMFFHVNGYDVVITPGELVALFLQTARGLMDQEELELFLRSRVTFAPKQG